MKIKTMYPAVLSFLFIGTFFHAQEYVSKKTVKSNGNVAFMTFKENTKLSSASANTVFKELLNISSDTEMKLEKSLKKDALLDEKYVQYYRNIPVEYGSYNLHYRNGKLASINGEIFSTESIITSDPAISAAEAFSLAVKSVGAKKYMWEDMNYMSDNSYKKPYGEKVFLPVQNGAKSYNLTLAYKFDIYAAEPISRAIIYVDATTGRVLASNALLMHTDSQSEAQRQTITVPPNNKDSFSIIESGNAETRYSGNKSIETKSTSNGYILSDETRGSGVHTYNLKKAITLSGVSEFSDTDNNWTSAEFDNDNYDNAALDAHWGIEKTYDYFKDTFNRNSFDDSGSLIKSYIHYGYGYENAGWTGSEMIYGDGVSLFNPLTAFDITAHELGHGVCQYTAKLAYERESGALNEGFSDIWGAIIEHRYAPEKKAFLIGEDITKVSPGYLRSMDNPKSGYNPQPDTYRGTNWKAATVEEGCTSPGQTTNDYCGVHTNSGVLNHWFYILVMGKTGVNDLGKAYNVTGIGWEKSEQIVYRLESVYLTSTSDFKNTRDLAIQTAQDLYGAGSAEAIAVQDAFFAVGIGYKYLATPDTTAPSIPLNLSANNITGTSLQLNWDASTDNEDMFGYIVYKDGVQIGTPTANTFKVTGLSKLTTYEFTVKAVDIFNNISNESIPLSIMTTDLAEYCQSKSNNASSERIKRVVFADIDNLSTATTGYEDFTSVQTEILKGQTYEISITPEWRASEYSEGYAVFIDWNSDGDFDDAGETAFTQSATKNNPVVGNITVPATASLNDPLQMRVSMKFNGIPTACETIPYGQVEDYRLIVKNQLSVIESENKKSSVYPNPTTGKINVKSNLEIKTLELFSANGQEIATVKNNNVIDLTNKPSGVYMLKISYADGTSSLEKIIKK